MLVTSSLGNSGQINILNGRTASFSQTQLGNTTGKGQELLSQAGLSTPLYAICSFREDGTEDTQSFGENISSHYSKDDAVKDVQKQETLAWVRQLLAGNGEESASRPARTANSLEMELYLAENKLSAQVDWASVSSDFSLVLSTASAANLNDCVDYLASRYVALSGQLERNTSGQELDVEKERLEEVFQKAQDTLASGYAGRLGSVLCFSESDIASLEESMKGLVHQRVEAFQEAQKQLDFSLPEEDQWLMNHDKYMAGQLRQASGDIRDDASYGGFTLGDLRLAGEIGGSYQGQYFSASNGTGGKEESLAMNLAFVDMQEETLFQKGLLSDNMRVMMRSSRHARHQQVLDVSNQRREHWRENAQPTDGRLADVNRDSFQEVYDTILKTFQATNDPLAAVRVGADYCKRTWGEQSSFADFYQARKIPGFQNGDWYSKLEKSSYESYRDNWLKFLASINTANPAKEKAAVDALSSAGENRELNVYA